MATHCMIMGKLYLKIPKVQHLHLMIFLSSWPQDHMFMKEKKPNRVSGSN